MASVVSMKSLLEAGVHFGHQTRRWNPKMAPYIYTERNGIYIVDLQKTVKKLEEAYAFVRQLSENGQSLLVRRHQEAGSGGHQGRGHPLRSVLCQRSLAGRHDDQLQDHAYPRGPSEPAEGHAD